MTRLVGQRVSNNNNAGNAGWIRSRRARVLGFIVFMSLVAFQRTTRKSNHHNHARTAKTLKKAQETLLFRQELVRGNAQLFLSNEYAQASGNANATSKEEAANQALLHGFPNHRSARFPSVEERIEIYMGSWYMPPCHKDDKFTFEYNASKVPSVTVKIPIINHGNNKTMSMKVESDATLKTLFFATRGDFETCRERYENIHHKKRVRNECLDVHNSIPRELLWNGNSRQDQQQSPPPPPIFLRVADGPLPHLVPSFHYCRSVAEMTPPQSSSSQRGILGCSHASTIADPRPPIVWNLNTDRFIKPLYQVAKNDCLWHEKKDMAVFRGALTGGGPHEEEDEALIIGAAGRNNNNASNALGGGKNKKTINDDDATLCQQIPRCQLVLMYSNSSLVDAALTGSLAETRFQQGGIINGVNLVGTGLSMAEQLRHKALIFLDGNDVASGVKWGMLSRSVVMMPRSKWMSWAMDGLLQPYVHYVPLKEDLSNVEEQVEWIQKHDQQARWIAHRGSLWIQDLVLHPQAATDDHNIRTEMLKRYAQHFVGTSSSSSSSVGASPTMQDSLRSRQGAAITD